MRRTVRLIPAAVVIAALGVALPAPLRAALRRSVPALAVVLLLAFALLAPVRRVRADRPLPQTDLYYPQCTILDQGGSGATTLYTVPSGEGFRQPLRIVGNVAACSLATQPFQNALVTFDLVSWDPATLAPPPGSIALQSRSYNTTSSTMNVARNDLLPPQITRALSNVAEPPPTGLAIEYRVTYNAVGAALQAQLASNDPSAALAASRILGDGSTAPLPGAHPVFAYAVCGGDDALQQMRVVQAVMTDDVDLAPLTYELIQKFQVPVATQLGWVEFALDRVSGSAPLDYGRVRIVDAQGQATPPIDYGTPLADANFIDDTRYPWTPRWCSHFDFATTPTLAAHHDYWLVLTTNSDYLPMGRALTGTESPYFQTAIGMLFARGGATLPAAEIPGRALAFRVIGTPTGTVDVDPRVRARAEFTLRPAPNPAHGATTITWSGARGTVALEVLDARGRRVASATSDAGRWSWKAVAADGHSLPAGIYFVRARDEDGRTSSARVTLMR